MTKSADAMTRSDALTEIFNFMDHKVRVVKIDGVPWFVGADLVEILYGRTSGFSHALDKVPVAEKAT
ncbi:hypothetical protein NYO66_04965 [Brucella sp. 2716]|nr:hypothetical protein NYO66_04965 [Brucella sp. 2716]